MAAKDFCLQNQLPSGLTALQTLVLFNPEFNGITSTSMGKEALYLSTIIKWKLIEGCWLLTKGYRVKGVTLMFKQAGNFPNS